MQESPKKTKGKHIGGYGSELEMSKNQPTKSNDNASKLIETTKKLIKRKVKSSKRIKKKQVKKKIKKPMKVISLLPSSTPTSFRAPRGVPKKKASKKSQSVEETPISMARTRPPVFSANKSLDVFDFKVGGSPQKVFEHKTTPYPKFSPFSHSPDGNDIDDEIDFSNPNVILSNNLYSRTPSGRDTEVRDVKEISKSGNVISYVNLRATPQIQNILSQSIGKEKVLLKSKMNKQTEILMEVPKKQSKRKPFQKIDVNMQLLAVDEVGEEENRDGVKSGRVIHHGKIGGDIVRRLSFDDEDLFGSNKINSKENEKIGEVLSLEKDPVKFNENYNNFGDVNLNLDIDILNDDDICGDEDNVVIVNRHNKRPLEMIGDIEGGPAKKKRKLKK